MVWLFCFVILFSLLLFHSLLPRIHTNTHRSLFQFASHERMTKLYRDYQLIKISIEVNKCFCFALMMDWVMDKSTSWPITKYIDILCGILLCLFGSAISMYAAIVEKVCLFEENIFNFILSLVRWLFLCSVFGYTHASECFLIELWIFDIACT